MAKMVIAPRLASQLSLPKNWQEQMAQISGVHVNGVTSHSMQATLTPEALIEAKDRFGEALIFETPTQVALAE